MSHPRPQDAVTEKTPTFKLKIFFHLVIHFNISLIIFFSLVYFMSVYIYGLRWRIWILKLSVFFKILSKFNFNFIINLVVSQLIFNLLLRGKKLILFAMFVFLNHCTHLKLLFITICYFLIYNILNIAYGLHLFNIIINLVLCNSFFILVISFHLLIFIFIEIILINLLIITENIRHVLF
jgi:hypothetical protein